MNTENTRFNALITGYNGSCAHYLRKEIGNCHGLARPDCELTIRSDVLKGLDAIRPDVIYHLASDTDVRLSFDEPQKVLLNNTLSTINIFEACLSLNIKPVIVICSTSEVYGNPGKWPITEYFTTDRQTNPYAVSKKSQESIANYYSDCYKFPVVITRAFGYINPRRKNLSLSSFARQIVEIEKGGRPYLRHGDLRSIRTFCDVRDIAKAYVKAAEHPGETFNIGSEYPISIGEALELLIRASQKEIFKMPEPSLFRPMEVTQIIPDCSKFRNATAWTPQIQLAESLDWLLSTFREQQ